MLVVGHKQQWAELVQAVRALDMLVGGTDITSKVVHQVAEVAVAVAATTAVVVVAG
jgi:hypothetical protein